MRAKAAFTAVLMSQLTHSVCACVFLLPRFLRCVTFCFRKMDFPLREEEALLMELSYTQTHFFFKEMAVRLKHMHTHHICRALGSQQNESKTVTISQTWMYPVWYHLLVFDNYLHFRSSALILKTHISIVALIFSPEKTLIPTQI